jgi:molybdopterin-guanine dinucleotide biosynthesis protein B
MAVIGFIGRSDSGKTSMIVSIAQNLMEKGFKVAAIKHIAEPGFKTIDREGSDTYRYASAGVSVIVGSADKETTIILKRPLNFIDTINLVEHISSPDVILVEGFKNEDNPKIALDDTNAKNIVLRGDNKEEIMDYIIREIEIERIYKKLPRLDCLKCGSDCKKMAERVYSGEASLNECVNLSDINIKIIINDEEVPMGKFVRELTKNTLIGLVSSLKGVNNIEKLELIYKNS